MTDAKRDNNRVTTIEGVSSVDSVTPALIEVNPATGAVLVEITTGSTSVAAPSGKFDDNRVRTMRLTSSVDSTTILSPIVSASGLLMEF